MRTLKIQMLFCVLLLAAAKLISQSALILNSYGTQNPGTAFPQTTLLPGTYCIVKFTLTGAAPPIVLSIVPAAGVTILPTTPASGVCAVKFNPAVTTTYTITPNGGTPFTYQVFVASAGSISVGQIPNPVSCPGDIVNLRVTTSYTPTGANPYGFFFGSYDVANNYYFPNNDVNTNTHTSLTGDVYVMSPNITTTDNHLWINTTAGSGMYDFTINVANVFCSSMPPPLPATINSTTYTGSNLYGTGTITINGTVVLNACTLQMSGSCKIVVPNGSVLRIDNSWLKACDICMWYGRGTAGRAIVYSK